MAQNSSKITFNLSDQKKWADILWVVFNNLIPLFGALFLNWTAIDVLFMYWIETLIIGIFNALKIFFAGGVANSRYLNQMPLKIFLVGFFCIHFGMFLYGQGSIAVSIMDDQFSFFNTFSEFKYLILFLFLSYLFSFLKDYIWLRGYQNNDPGRQMFAPYGRIIVQHIVAMAIGFLSILTGNSANIIFILLLILVKTAVDIVVTTGNLKLIFSGKSK